MTPVLTLENFIDKALETLTPEQREKRAQVIKERENPPRKRMYFTFHTIFLTIIIKL